MKYNSEFCLSWGEEGENFAISLLWTESISSAHTNTHFQCTHKQQQQVPIKNFQSNCLQAFLHSLRILKREETAKNAQKTGLKIFTSYATAGPILKPWKAGTIKWVIKRFVVLGAYFFPPREKQQQWSKRCLEFQFIGTLPVKVHKAYFTSGTRLNIQEAERACFLNCNLFTSINM